MENKYSNKYLLETGIGLQDVDHLKNSSYFTKESQRYFKGEISLEELDEIITSYYKNRPSDPDANAEADQTSIRIAQLLSEDSFTFTVGQLVNIHKYLFDGVFKHAGKLRTYNFSKNEWVLDGDTVTYGDYRDLAMTLQFDFNIEKEFNYSLLTTDEIIEHLAIFVANLWQIHVFEEGNTRTTAVFFIKYLRTFGFDVTNDMFAKNAWYFRNALVRANYTNIKKGVFEDRSYLVKFLRNLLLGEQNQLNNRDLHINVSTSAMTEITKENRIIELIKSNPYIKSIEISDKLGVSLRTTKNLILTLVKSNMIKRVNGKRYGYWEIIKEQIYE